MSEHFDAIVVGSGFGGSVMAYRLAQAGMRVCVLERGRAYAPGDFPRTPRGMRQNFWDPQAGLYGLFNVWSFAGLDALVASGVGGGSLIYTNVLLRKPAHTFVQGDPSDPDAEDWPIGYDELKPHYEAVEAMLRPQPYPFDKPPYSSTPRMLLMQRAAGELGLHWEPAPLAVRFAAGAGEPERLAVPLPHEPHNLHGRQRLTCVLCGECAVGCNHGSKNSLDHTYLSLAKNKHNAVIMAGCDVREIRSLRRGYAVSFARLPVDAPAPAGPPPNTTERLTADQLVLAAGALGSTYLLLRNRRHLPRLSRRLGTRFCTNGDMLAFAGDLPADAVPDPGMSGLPGPVITSSLATERIDAAGLPRAIYIQDAGAPQFAYWMLFVLDLPRALWAERGQLARLLWQQLRRKPDTNLSAEIAALFSHGWLSERLLPMLAMGQDAPDGVLRLRGRKRPVLEIDWRLRRSTAHFQAASARLRAIAKALRGSFRDSAHRRRGRAITSHPLGGCPMGRDPERGVVDRNGEVFGYPGLFVADGAVMPGPVGPNPSLTIAALADHFAVTAIANYRSRAFLRRQPAQLRFRERLRGRLELGAGGAPARIELRLHLRIADLAGFRDDPSHLALASGYVLSQELGGRLPIEQGWFNMFVDVGPPSVKQMRYRLLVRSPAGQPLTIDGVKRLERGGAGMWADTTTLHTRVMRGHVRPSEPDGEELGAGVLTIGLAGVARMLSSIRASGSPREQAAALVRFGLLYLRNIRQVYW